MPSPNELRCAILSHQQERVIALLDAGLAPDAYDDFSMTGMAAAAQANNISAAILLHQRGASFDQADGFDNLPIYHAIMGRHVAFVRWLLAQGAACPPSMLAIAAGYSSMEVFEIVYDQLGAAALDARYPSVLLSLSWRTPPSMVLRTPAIAAAVSGHHESLMFLLRRGADTEAREAPSGATALAAAAYFSHVQCVATLLAVNPEIEARDAAGGTPLVAALMGYRSRGDLAAAYPIIMLLLYYGANPEARATGLGCSALDLAESLLGRCHQSYAQMAQRQSTVTKRLLASIGARTPTRSEQAQIADTTAKVARLVREATRVRGITGRLLGLMRAGPMERAAACTAWMDELPEHTSAKPYSSAFTAKLLADRRSAMADTTGETAAGGAAGNTTPTLNGAITRLMSSMADAKDSVQTIGPGTALPALTSLSSARLGAPETDSAAAASAAAVA